MPLETFIGTRYLLSRKSQMFISLITIISVLGVTLGVMALIVVLSVQAGFENDLKKKILGNSSHLILLKYGGLKIANYLNIIEQLHSKFPGILGMTPTLYNEVLLTTENNTSSGVMLKGIDPVSAGSVLNINKNIISRSKDIETKIVEGEKVTDLDQILVPGEDGMPRIIIGTELSKQLLVFPGDIISILSPQGEITPFGNVPRIRKFRVSAIFKTGMWEYDSKFVYTHIFSAQQFLALSDVASYIEMRIENIDHPKFMGYEVTRLLGPPFLTRDWQDLNGDLFDALKLERTVTFITLAMVIIVAAFSIVATLVMMVIEKAKDIAILKTMGATSNQILKIFVLSGMAIGMVGITLGELLGIGLSILIRDYIKWPLNPSVYFIDTLPVKIEPAYCLVVAAFTIAIIFIATIYPSWKAASLRPVDGLRYE